MKTTNNKSGLIGTAVVLMIPPIVIFVCSQSQILETMAHSGMKD